MQEDVSSGIDLCSRRIYLHFRFVECFFITWDDDNSNILCFYWLRSYVVLLIYSDVIQMIDYIWQSLLESYSSIIDDGKTTESITYVRDIIFMCSLSELMI